MPSCTGCGAHVSADYARVLGDRDGNVACLSCRSQEATSWFSEEMGATYRVAPP